MGKRNGKYVACENCGKMIYRTQYRLEKNIHQFCCVKCQKEYEHKQSYDDRKCEVCGKIMHVSKKSTQRFCSYECQSEWQKTRIGDLNPRTTCFDIECDWCGKMFKIKPSVFDMRDNHFCSNNCRQEWYSQVFSQSDDWKEKSRVRAVKILSDGLIPFTNTKPQIIINTLLDEMNIKYRNEEPFKYYSADNYLCDYNLIIEVMGDFWHGSPLKYTVDQIRPNQKKTISRDKAKHTYIKKYYGIEILYLWEKDIYERLPVCKSLIAEYISCNGIMDEYNSFNYDLVDNQLQLNETIIIPYQDRKIA